jgi:hypothetical protein
LTRCEPEKASFEQDQGGVALLAHSFLLVDKTIFISLVVLKRFQRLDHTYICSGQGGKQDLLLVY